jgi:hypothetical protein
MKTYSKNSSVRKPMMYGGMAAPTKKRKIMNVGGMATSMPMAGPFGAGMMADKKKKQAMGMMYGGNAKKKKMM